MVERLAALGHRFLFLIWRLLVVAFLVVPLLGFSQDHHFGERMPGHDHLLSEEDLVRGSAPEHLHFFQVPHGHWHGVPIIGAHVALASELRGINWQSANESDNSGGLSFVAGLPHSVPEVSSIVPPEAAATTDLLCYHGVIPIPPPDPPPVNA